MSAADRLSGYAGGFGNLDADAIAANVTDDYKLLDKDGAIYGKNDLPVYIEELKKINVVVNTLCDGLSNAGIGRSCGARSRADCSQPIKKNRQGSVANNIFNTRIIVL